MNDDFDDADRLIAAEATAPGVVSLKMGSSTRTVTPDEARVVASAIHEAANVASYTEDERPEWYRRFMQHLVLEICTHPDLIDEGHTQQAGKVYCWVRDQTQTNAFHISTGWANDAGWIVTRVLEHRDVIRDVFDLSDHVNYYDQALIDGQVFFYEVAPTSVL